MKIRLLTLFLLCPLFSISAGEVLFLMEKGFNRQEFYDLYLPLKALGYEIDIASTEAGTVYLRKEGTPDKRGRDVPANLAMRDVKDLSGYLALAIPGGYSPGFLEDNPDAQRIVQAFAADPDQMTAAICHGPRLLMAAGSLKGRVWTGLHNIASEKPNSWVKEGRGTYVDQQVIKDRDLLTSRYPQDTPVLARRLAEELAAKGGKPLPTKTGVYALVLPKDFDRHVRWSWTSPLKTLGFQLVTVSSPEELEEKVEGPVQGVIRARFADTPGSDLPVFGRLPMLDLLIPEGDFAYPDALPEILAFVDSRGAVIPEKEITPPDVAIVLSEGADEKVVLAMTTYYEAQGQKVVLTGGQTGWVNSLGGLPLHIDAAMQDLDKVKVVVAPGGLWPQKSPNARQGETADWIEGQAEKDAARQGWILEQLDAGAELVLVGLDALRLGRDPRFKGQKFSSTRQAQWSFGKTGGRFSTDPFTRSAEKIWSISGYEALPLWIRAQHLSE